MKKPVTPEKAVLRLKIIFGAVAVMLIFMMWARFTRPKNEEVKRDLPPVETAMDELLDSIVMHDYPSGTKVLKTNNIERLEMETKENQEERFLIQKLEYLEASGKDDIAEMEKTRNELQKVQKRNEKYDKIYRYYRHVTIEEPDGNIFVCYQSTSDELTESKLVYRFDLNKKEDTKEKDNNINTEIQ